MALPIREQLRNNYRYMDIGFDIDQRFGSAAGIENLRKWVRSQRTQETERVEAERNRLPGSPPGRPLSEVQKLRARVFAEVINAEKNGTAGSMNASAADGHGTESATQAQSTPAPAAQAPAGGSGSSGGGGGGGGGKSRDTSMEPLSTLFPSPSNGRNGGAGGGGSELPSSSGGFQGGNASSTPVYGGGSSGFSEGGGGGAHPAVAAATAAAMSAAAAVGTTTTAALPGSMGTPALESGLGNSSSKQTAAARRSVYVTNNSRWPLLAPKPAIMMLPETYAFPLVTHPNVGLSGFGDALAAIGAAGGVGPAEARPSAAAVGLVRRRLPTESTPDDFRRGDSALSASGSKKKKAKVDHSEVVGKVLTQVNNLNLPLAALELLVESLRAEIAEARGTDGSPPPAGHVAGAGGGGGASVGTSLAERQLLLEEKVHASREAEAAQTLAERRLKLMEDMRAAGDKVVTEEVIQKQRLVVLGLEAPLVPRGSVGIGAAGGSGGGGVV